MALAIGAEVMAGGLAQVPPAVFRTNVEAIRVDVLVRDGGRPVTGLGAADFEIRDRGVVQAVETCATEDLPLSVMLALDVSSSVDGSVLAHLKEAARSAVTLLQEHDRAALMTFSGAVRLGQNWTGDRSALLEAVANTTAFGSTSLHDAAYAALTLRDTRPGRTLVLLFSDGADTSSWLPGESVIETARRNDAVVYAVTLRSPNTQVVGYRLDFHSGIQSRIDLPEFTVPMNAADPLMTTTFLDALAQETGGKALEAVASQQLRDTFIQVMTEFRTRYLLTYTARGVDEAGWHPIEVRLRQQRGTITARRGYVR